MEINVEERVQLAEDFFMEGYNCCQAVVMAFQDVLGVDKEVLATLSVGLGGGVGRMREVCGTVSAMAIISGSLAKSEGESIHQQKTDAYTIVQELAGKFREENGSIICHELMNLRAQAHRNPVPEERTKSYYASRPCARLVGCSARIVAEKLKTISLI